MFNNLGGTMSIRPIDMQVSVNKTVMVNKAHNTQSNLERAMVSDSSQRAIEKNIEQNNRTVVKASKDKREVNKDGKNKNNDESSPKEKSRREKKEEELKLINKSKMRNNHHKESFFDIGV